jgi:tetratricopeptide (TPR) repeat protein
MSSYVAANFGQRTGPRPQRSQASINVENSLVNSEAITKSVSTAPYEGFLVKTPRYQGIINPEPEYVMRRTGDQPADLEAPTTNRPLGSPHRSNNTLDHKEHDSMLHSSPKANRSPNRQQQHQQQQQNQFSKTTGSLPSPLRASSTSPLRGAAAAAVEAPASPLRGAQHAPKGVQSKTRQATVSAPQRVNPPAYMSLPVSFPPTALVLKESSPDSPKEKSEKTRQKFHQERKLVKEKIKDYQHRADACERAGRKRNEANANFSIAALHESTQDFLSAIHYYKLFLEIMKRIGDKVSTALAYNCIGVCYQHLGERFQPLAAEHHLQHHQLALADAEERFISSTNLGLVCGATGNWEECSAWHKAALAAARECGSARMQSIALGNLGLTANAQSDLASARDYMRQQVQLSSPGDLKAQGVAFGKLGLIAEKQGDFGEAADFFTKAMHIAHSQKDKAAEAFARISLGVARAHDSLEEHMKRVADTMLHGKPMPPAPSVQARAGKAPAHPQAYHDESQDRYFDGDHGQGSRSYSRAEDGGGGGGGGDDIQQYLRSQEYELKMAANQCEDDY